MNKDINSRFVSEFKTKELFKKMPGVNKKTGNEIYNLYIAQIIEKIKPAFFGIFITSTLLFSGETKSFELRINSQFNRLCNFAWDDNKKILVFSLFKREKSKNSDDDILRVVKNNKGSLEVDFEKDIYHSDEDKIISLIKTKKERIENTLPNIYLTNGIVEKAPNPPKKISKDEYLGSMGINSLKYKNLDRCIFSAPYCHTHASINIYPDNLLLATSHFALRSVLKSIVGEGLMIPKEFVTARDEIMNNRIVSNTKMREFLFDCLVFSLFEDTSYQSSLRRSNGSSSDVKNEWYILSSKETKEYLHEFDLIDSIKDTSFKDSFIYLFLEKNSQYISQIAKGTLESVRNIYRDTFSLRKTLITKFPKYQLNTFDTGFWQLRHALIDYSTYNKKIDIEKIFESFKINFNSLKNKIAKNAIELGFFK